MLSSGCCLVVSSGKLQNSSFRALYMSNKAMMQGGRGVISCSRLPSLQLHALSYTVGALS